MAKTLCDDGVAAPVASSPAPDVSGEASPPVETQEPTAAPTASEPTPEPTRPPGTTTEQGVAARLIEDLNADDTIALATGGRFTAETVLAAEHATKQRKTVIDALTHHEHDEEQ